MSICLQTQILFLLKVSKKNHQNIPDQPSMNKNIQTQCEFLEDSSDKLFLNFSTQIYRWIPGYLVLGVMDPLQRRIRWYALLGA